MLKSRALLLGRIISNGLKAQGGCNKQIVRNSSEWYYRETKKPVKSVIIAANTVGGLMWWWVLWHLWHEHEHITGEFPYPDPLQWTNAELGIPPDDYDEE